jgi:hypothetical protein
MKTALPHRLWQAPYFAEYRSSNELVVEKEKENKFLFLGLLFTFFIVIGIFTFDLSGPVGTFFYVLLCGAIAFLGFFAYANTMRFLFSNTLGAITICPKLTKEKTIPYDSVNSVRMKTTIGRTSRSTYYHFRVELELASGPPRLLFIYAYHPVFGARAGDYQRAMMKAVKLGAYVSEFMGKKYRVEDDNYNGMQ